jgi:hypothetical protein
MPACGLPPYGPQWAHKAWPNLCVGRFMARPQPPGLGQLRSVPPKKRAPDAILANRKKIC